MASATIAEGILTLNLRTWDKILSVHGSLHIPLNDILTATSGAPPRVPLFTKVIGGNLPGVFAAGTFYDAEGLLFYDYGVGHECVILELTHERFHRVVVEIDAPQTAAGVAAEIQAALASGKSSAAP